MSTQKFFIRDCNGAIVGNPAGYRTIRGALAQQNRPGSPAYNAIWRAFDSTYPAKNDGRMRHVSSVRLAGEA